VNCTLEFANKGGDVLKAVVDNLTTKGDWVGNKSD
jgi:hypothetical protein